MLRGRYCFQVLLACSLILHASAVARFPIRHAKEAEENPTWISKAYKETQPKTVFTDKTAEQEEEESKKAYLEQR